MWAPVAQLLAMVFPVGTPLQRHYLLFIYPGGGTQGIWVEVEGRLNS